MTAQPHALAVAGAAVGTTTTSVFFLPITRGATLTSSQLSCHARRAGHNTPWRPQRRDMTPNVTPEAPRATLCCSLGLPQRAGTTTNTRHGTCPVSTGQRGPGAYTAKAATTRDRNTHTRGGLGTAQLLLGVWPRCQLGATAERRCVLEANSGAGATHLPLPRRETRAGRERSATLPNMRVARARRDGAGTASASATALAARATARRILRCMPALAARRCRAPAACLRLLLGRPGAGAHTGRCFRIKREPPPRQRQRTDCVAGDLLLLFLLVIASSKGSRAAASSSRGVPQPCRFDCGGAVR